MKTIVFIHHGSTLGGAPFSMLDILKQADLKLFRIKVVLPNEGPLCKLLKENNIDYEIWPLMVFYYCSQNKTFSRNNPIFLNCLRGLKIIINSFFNLCWMPFFLLRVKPDLVVINTSTPLLCGFLVRLFRIKLVWHIREVLSQESNLNITNMIAATINFSAKKVLVNSLFSKEDLMRIGIKDATVIYNSVDLSKFNLNVLRSHVRETLNLSDHEFLIGWTNQISSQKGWRTLLKAAFILSNEMSNIRFLIVGANHGVLAKSAFGSMFSDKTEEEMFKESVKGLNLCRNFIFLGERHDVEFLLRALDCLVFPAEQPETFGKVIIEAMACGIPVIASNIGATSEIITDGKDGILVQPKDPVELAEALKSVLVNLKTTDQLSRAARETVERRFDMQMNVQKIWKTYNSIITV